MKSDILVILDKLEMETNIKIIKGKIQLYKIKKTFSNRKIVMKEKKRNI